MHEMTDRAWGEHPSFLRKQQSSASGCSRGAPDPAFALGKLFRLSPR